MTKNIVLCTDGTWNGPDRDVNDDLVADPTNVYKLFFCLRGEFDSFSINLANEQEKYLNDSGVKQVAKYIHGVGDSRNYINKLVGGTLGAGLIARIVRGYTFISRHYNKGDNIYIIGFSRGAYTARAVAGMIARQGLLAVGASEEKTRTYQRGIKAWFDYRSATHNESHFNLLHHLSHWFIEYKYGLFSNVSDVGTLIPVERLAAVAVWETVGSMGIPHYAGNGERVDLFQFSNLKLSPKVEHGYQAVSLDEQRADFTPTLWDSANHVTQRLFSGAHSDLGGGYPVQNNESGLSDGTLKWMITNLDADNNNGTGVLFSNPLAYSPIKPDPAGVAHAPWIHFPWDKLKYGPRHFPDNALTIDNSVLDREDAGKVLPDPSLEPQDYNPVNLPKPA